jgi:dTMP kinase
VTPCANPGGTPLGEQLRSLLLDPRWEKGVLAEAFLFMANHADLTERVVRPSLAAGSAVVMDRFLLSTVAYQGHASGLDPAEVWRLGRLATQGLEPDLYVVLDMPVALSLGRRKAQADRVEGRTAGYHEAVRQGFLMEASNRKERICVVDATGPVEAVWACIEQEVTRVLAARSGA